MRWYTVSYMHGKQCRTVTGTLAHCVRLCPVLDDLDIDTARLLKTGDQFGGLNYTLHRLPDKPDEVATIIR